MMKTGIYIYILRCADGSYYVGSATGHDVSTRVDQHNAGSYPGYTYSRRPVVLVWSEYFDRITDGIAAERQIKLSDSPTEVLRSPLLGEHTDEILRQVLGFSDHQVAEIHDSGALDPPRKQAAE